MNAPLPIEIVGGGLAGLAAGLALARAGLRVTVFEAAGYPRHRVCGEFISGLDEATSNALGLPEFLAGSMPHCSVTYHLRGKPLRTFPLPATAWGISRHTLDARLASAFVAAGGELRTHTRVDEGELPAGRVFASGRNRKGPFWVGLKIHVRNLALINDFEVHLGDQAYVGLSRVETGSVNLCGIFSQRQVAERGAEMLPAYLSAAGLGTLAERVRSAECDTESFCVTAATLGDRGVAKTDRARIGDACASIPPFTGNGIAMALQSAALAVAPLRAYARGETTWARCVRVIGSAQRHRFRRRLMFASVLHPFLLEHRRQSLLAGLARSHLLPFSAFYGALR